MSAVFARREDYCSKLQQGFGLPVVTLMQKTADPCDSDYDSSCSLIREAFAGAVTYLKQFRFLTGYEAYFVLDMPFERIHGTLERLQAENTCFDPFDTNISVYKKSDR